MKYVVALFSLFLFSGCANFPLPTSPEHVSFVPNPNDPVQNYEDNCWFVAAESAWALRDPQQVQNAIGQEGNDWVIYIRNLETQGVQKVIIPNTIQNQNDIYNPMSTNPDWPEAFAYAYDKVNGGSAAESAGGPINFFSAFAPGYAVLDTPDDPQFDTFLELTNTQPGILATNVVLADTENLVPSHCYTVVSVTKYTVTLRNPWGIHASNNGYLTIPRSEIKTNFNYLVYAVTK